MRRATTTTKQKKKYIVKSKRQNSFSKAVYKYRISVIFWLSSHMLLFCTRTPNSYIPITFITFFCCLFFFSSPLPFIKNDSTNCFIIISLVLSRFAPICVRMGCFIASGFCNCYAITRHTVLSFCCFFVDRI